MGSEFDDMPYMLGVGNYEVRKMLCRIHNNIIAGTGTEWLHSSSPKCYGMLDRIGALINYTGTGNDQTRKKYCHL